MNIIQRGGAKLVFGLGKTGIAVIEFLQAHNIIFRVADSREKHLIDYFNTHNNQVNGVFGVELAALLEDKAEIAQLLNSVDELILSPGIPPTHALVIAAQSAGIPIINDITLFVRYVRSHAPQVKLVGITGSNGKSTVTYGLQLMGQALGIATRAVGNIGVPVLDVISQLDQLEVIALELSSFQLEINTDLGLDIAVLLNISSDHVDRHGNLINYWHAKQRIFEQVKACVINRDAALSTPNTQGQSIQAVVRFGLASPDKNDFGIMQRNDGQYIAHGINILMRKDQLALPGEHNCANALALLSLAQLLGWSIAQACEFLKTYSGLPHRFQLVPTNDDIIWINDSKATNVGAALAALQSMRTSMANKPLYWIGGGQGKGADFTPLVQELSVQFNSHHLLQAVVYGEDRQALYTDLNKAGVLVSTVNTLNDAMELIFQHVIAGQAVLFSPACASLDQFKNFEHRGQVFMDKCP